MTERPNGWHDDEDAEFSSTIRPNSGPRASMTTPSAAR
jgi:hypothetical protein